METTGSTRPSALGGLWLPLITPFRDGELDERSLRRLVRHYAGEPIDGFILGATTGEGMALDEAECERLVAVTNEALSATGRRIPVYFGLSGSDTLKTAGDAIDGVLVSGPDISASRRVTSTRTSSSPRTKSSSGPSRPPCSTPTRSTRRT